MIKKTFSLSLSLIFLFFTACTGYTESDSKYIISAMGFERLGEEIIINIQTLSADEGKEEITQNAYSFSSSTPIAAFNGAKTRLAKPVTLEHCSAIILSPDLKREDIINICEFCKNAERLNTSVYFAVCKDVKGLLECKAVSQAAGGYDISAFIETRTEDTGMSYKNRLYEILSAKEDFSPTFNLPFFIVEDGEFYIDGEYVYKDFSSFSRLDNTQSLLLSVITNRYSGGNLYIENEAAQIDTAHTYFSADLKEDRLYIKLKTKFCFKEHSQNFKNIFESDALRLLNKKEDIYDFAKLLEQKERKLFEKIKDNYKEYFNKSIIEYSVEVMVK